MSVVLSGLAATVATEDLADLGNLELLYTPHVQPWCLSKLEQYRCRIKALRTLYNLGVLGIPNGEAEHALLLNLQDTELHAADLVGLPGSALEKIEECKSRMRALRSLYNSFAPVNRMLPLELLMEVFSYLRPDFNRRWGMSILHICRLWTQVMYQTPRFWANLLATHRVVTEPERPSPTRIMHRYRLALKYSAGVRLSLSMRGMPVELAELLRPHAHRIAELHVEMARSTEGLNRLLEAGMPVLEVLAVTPWISKWNHAELQPPDCIRLPVALPPLRGLRLAAGHTGTLTLTSLRWLELTNCWCTGCRARDRRVDDVLRVLAECPGLEHLALRKCFPRDIQDSPILFVHLPCLYHLVIEGERDSAALILSRLVFPSTTDLELYLPGRFKLPSPIDMQSFQAIKDADSIAIDLNRPNRGPGALLEVSADGCLTLRVRGTTKDYIWGTPDEDCDPQAPAAVRYTDDIADIFASSSSLVRSLVVMGALTNEVRRTEHDPWGTLFDTFPALAHLHIGYPSDQLAVVLGALCRPMPDGRCRCPALRRLTILWASEASWPWVLLPDPMEALLRETGLEDNTPADSVRGLLAAFKVPGGLDARTRYWKKEECEQIRSMRETSETPHAHVETDDVRTWLPYGAAETRSLCETVVTFLALRRELGAAGLTDLCVEVLPRRNKRTCFMESRSFEDRRRDEEYLQRHCPEGLLETRLAQLLEGQVASIEVRRWPVDLWDAEED